MKIPYSIPTVPTPTYAMKGAAPDQQEIQNELDGLGKALDSMSDSLSALLQRLGPVSRFVDATAMGCPESAQMPSGRSMVGERIAASADEVRRLDRLVQERLSALAL